MKFRFSNNKKKKKKKREILKMARAVFFTVWVMLNYSDSFQILLSERKLKGLVPSVLPRNFITGDNVPGHLKMWGHLRKKRGHCVKNGTVIWR